MCVAWPDAGSGTGQAPGVPLLVTVDEVGGVMAAYREAQAAAGLIVGELTRLGVLVGPHDVVATVDDNGMPVVRVRLSVADRDRIERRSRA